MELQSEVNTDKIGIFGVSMGGSMVWNIAAIDKRVKASVAIYGGGWAQYPDKFDNKTFAPDNQTKIWLSGMTPQIYAKYINTPIMLLSSSNDFHGNMDRICDTFDSLSATTIRRLSFGVSHNHHIEYDQVPNLLLWFDSHFKTNKAMPKNPQITIEKGIDGIPEVLLTVDDETNILWVKMFYALENTNPRNRYWQEVTAEKYAENIYVIKAPVMDINKHLFAYASVKYKDGLHLSSKLATIIPNELSCAATAKKTKIIYDASEGKKGWAARHWSTDPIPLAPHYVYEDHLFEPVGGGISTCNNKKIITSRLTDPRFLNNDENLEFEFFSETQGEVEISFGDEILRGKPFSDFEKTYKLTLNIGMTKVVIHPHDLNISNWHDYPQIIISGLDSEKIKLCNINWGS